MIKLQYRLAFLALAITLMSAISFGDESNRITPTVRAAAKTLPSVVNISTERIVTQRFNRNGLADPFSELFNRFFGHQERHYRTSSLGSGVVVDADGLILTNNHVIQRASKIIVTLEDGTDIDAKPIATDEENDLALLSFDPAAVGGAFRSIDFAAPGDVLLGEPVISVGNPFGLGHSVATGVISAIDRKVIYERKVLFDDILQTDAAVNPGNSGGPIVNADGELVGINLAIHDDAQGIGFAIPLKRIEKVLSSWLVPSRFGLNLCGLIPATTIDENGNRVAVVRAIIPDTPASRTTLKVGDVITAVNGVAVRQAIDVGRILWKLKENDVVKLDLEGERTVQLTVAPIAPLSGELLARNRLKIELQLLTQRLSDALGLPYSRGLVVSDVTPDCPLARKGIRRGDVILQVGETPITDFTDLYRALGQQTPGDGVLLVVDRVEILQGHVFLQRFSVETIL